MPTFSYSVTEHDPVKPWLVLGTGRHLIELNAGEDFYRVGSGGMPSPRFSVQLDPWQLQQPGLDR